MTQNFGCIIMVITPISTPAQSNIPDLYCALFDKSTKVGTDVD